MPADDGRRTPLNAARQAVSLLVQVFALAAVGVIATLAAAAPTLEVGGPTDPDGDPQPEPDREDKHERKRGLGRTAREHRKLREFYLILRRLKREQPRMDDKERRAEAQRLVDEQVPEKGQDKVFDREYDKLALYFKLPFARLTLTLMQLATVMCLPEMRWLVGEYLAGVDADGKDTEGGRPALRGRLVAGLIVIAMSRRKADAFGVWQQLNRERNHTLAMALGWPSGSQTTYGGYLRGLHSVAERKNTRVARAMCVEFVRQLSLIPSRRGKGVAYPKVGRYLAVDAMLVQANMAPLPPVGDDEHDSVNASEHAQVSRGRKFQRARFIRIAVGGKITFRSTAWKWVQIIDLRSGRPVIGKLVESVGVEVERWVVVDLLRELFRWWEHCPAKYLVTDGLYAAHWAADDSFAEVIYRDWGLFLVAPAPGSDPSPDGSDRGRRNQKETLGVPHCSCRSNPRPMELHGWEDLYTPERRAAEGITRGQAAPIAAKAAWKCANGHPECKRKYTYMRDNWRVHTYLPYIGEHRLVKKRAVLSLARNRMEGVFGVIKKLGLAGVAADRAEWAGDEEMEWLLSLAALSLTARAVAHHHDIYKDVYAWAERLNVLQPVDLDDDTPEATPQQRREYLAWVRERLGPAKPPPMLRRDGKENTPIALVPRSSALDPDLDVDPDLEDRDDLVA